MKKKHKYNSSVIWTGNKGKGTLNYEAYDRSHSILLDGKPEISCSADPEFKGDKTKYNPEELLLSSLSSCHMLWYLHLCAESKIVITEYIDKPTGTLLENIDGSGHFTEVILNPRVVVAKNSMIEKASELHKKANELCFIANSVKFEVFHHCECSSEENKIL
ncbi:MAG: OsmC family protein [Saonia sp.]